MTAQASLTPLRNLFRLHGGRISLTYGLTLLENVFELLYPFVTGIAINGLVKGNYISLLPLALTWIVHTLSESLRQMYDTRTFSGIYSKLAARVVLEQTRLGVPTSQIIARSSLSREFVDFFEQDMPLTINATIGFVGTVGMLFWYDAQIGAYCLMILIPVIIINRRYGRFSLRLNQRLNDQLEREVDVLSGSKTDTVQQHYRLLKHWRVKLSDAEAKNWGLTTLLMGGLVVLVLIRAVTLPNVEAGDIYTIVTYTMSFTYTMDEFPFLVQQVGRLKDIGYRISSQGILEN